MKIATLTCVGLGLLGALLAALTALGTVPGFVDFGLGLGDIVGMESIESIITTAFWGGLSLMLLLAAIAFGTLSKEEL